MSKLDRLLESISPQRTIEPIYNLANEVVGSFHSDKARTETWEEFKLCMARFLKHLDKKLLRLEKPLDVPLTEYWKYCIRPLLKIYGSNGDVTAFILGSTGNEGGLYSVLKAFAMYKAEEYTRRRISTLIFYYWESLSAIEKLEASDEYISKYKDIIPSEIAEEHSCLIQGFFWKYLEKHPFIVQKLQQTGR